LLPIRNIEYSNRGGFAFPGMNLPETPQLKSYD